MYILCTQYLNCIFNFLVFICGCDLPNEIDPIFPDFGKAHERFVSWTLALNYGPTHS